MDLAKSSKNNNILSTDKNSINHLIKLNFNIPLSFASEDIQIKKNNNNS
jgi:hypothetical protein